ncbi:MAG: hypothetical protein ACRD5Z_11530 [Bryobacteraceae bacterium]
MKTRLPPNVYFHPDIRLMIFRHRGILDEERVNTIVAYIEKEEDLAEKPFNRFADLSKLDAIDLDFQFLFRICLHRRLVYAHHPPVKSAFYVTSSAAVRVVRIHALMTDHSPLKVAMFEDLAQAAKWLGVPKERLEV